MTIFLMPVILYGWILIRKQGMNKRGIDQP